MRHWSELPRELLEIIQGRLNSYVDKVRVRAVCLSWKSHLPKVRIPLPRLLLEYGNKSNPTHGLYSLVEKRFDLLDLPELQGKLFKSSFYGWVVAIDNAPCKTSPYIFLINPLTKDQIQLPPRHTFPDVKEYNVENLGKEYTLLYPGQSYSVHSNFALHNLLPKVVFSSSPSSDDCVFVAIYGALRSLAWCKYNDNSWTSLYETTVQPFSVGRPPITDIIFYQGRLYALNHYQILVFENIGGPDQKVTQILRPFHYNSPMYLVESSDGELLMVQRYVDVDKEPSLPAPCTECFKVNKPDLTYSEGFKVNKRDSEGFKVYKRDLTYSSWLEVKNIGDDMLFLGINSCWSISSRKYSGCKGNCIYFAGSSWGLTFKGSQKFDSDIGVFNMEDGSFESLPGLSCAPRFLWPPPIWVYDVDS